MLPEASEAHDGRRLTPLLGLLIVATIGMWGWSLAVLDRPADAYATLGLAVVGAILELTGVSWPAMGFSSAAPACYLALVLLPASARGANIGWAALALLAGVLLRTLTRGGDHPWLRLREAVATAFPIVLTLALARLAAGGTEGWRTFLLLDVYLAAAFLVPAQLVGELSSQEESRWRRVRARTVTAWLSVGFLAPPLAWLGSPRALWLLPVLVGLQRSCAAAVESVREEDNQRLARELEESRRGERKAREHTARVRKELEIKVEERALFEELGREFTNSPDLESTLQATVAMVLRLVPACRSAAVFLEENGVLQPVALESPERKRIQSLDLLEVDEPIVTRAWQEQREVILSPAFALPQRLFPNERAAVALPLAGGVLFAGSMRAELEVDGPQVNLLRLLAGQAGEAIKAAQRYQQLESQARYSGKLREEVTQLAELLESAWALTSSIEIEPSLDALESRLERMVPHHSRGITLFDPPRQRGALHEEVVQTVAASGKPYLLPSAPDGSLLAVPMQTEAGLLGVIVLGHHQNGAFTRQHQDTLMLLGLQSALALHNARLHEQVREALVRLKESEAQLVQSSKMAAVGQLAAGVAHELNTPLGTILLAIQSALRSPAIPEKLRPLLDRACVSGARAKDIVEKLLYYSRDARVGRRNAELEAVVRDTLELIGQQLRLDGVKIQFLKGAEGAVLCNQNEIQQVLMNLLLNARDAILSDPDAPREIIVRTLAGPTQAVLEVRDQGPGVPQEDQSRIFEPFFTTKPLGQGTGLGLSVSEQIVRSHGGTLTYEPQYPRGSIFRMMLPTSTEPM